MKRSLRITLLSGAAALILAFGGAAVPAFADTTDASSSSTSASSSSAVTSQTTQATETLNPIPNASISLTSAPNIGFAATVVPDTKDNQTYTATSADNPIEVSNEGLPSGYNVQISNSQFADATGDQLGGATLSFGAPTVESANSGNPSAAPTASAVKLLGNNTNSLLLSAPLKGGLGVFDANFGLADISLAVPAGQLAGSYTSNLTFTLGNTVQ